MRLCKLMSPEIGAAEAETELSRAAERSLMSKRLAKTRKWDSIAHRVQVTGRRRQAFNAN